VAAEAREQRFVFGEVAELYDRARAGYPADVIDDVLRFTGVDPDRLRALEVGAGTGKATLAFAARGVEILALEPSPEMAAVAARNCRELPRVRIVRSTFEDWRLEERGFGLLFAAQSWHWVAPEVRWARAARALSPGGTLALLGHSVRWRGEPLRDELEDVYRRVAPALLTRNPGFPGLHDVDDDAYVDEIQRTELFGGVTSRSHPWSEHFSADGFLDRLATQSDHRLLTDTARGELFAAVRELVSARDGGVDVPHVTTVTVARLR
jgi:SAM-dependent methyltransferase